MSLCQFLFTCALFRRTKAALKMHVFMDPDDYLPALVLLGPAKKYEVKKAQTLQLPKGSFVAADLGYTNYGWNAHS